MHVMHTLLFSHALRLDYLLGWETKSATPELLQTPSRGVSLCVLGHSSSSLRLISLQSRLLPIKSPSLLFNQVSAYGGEFTSRRDGAERKFWESEKKSGES